MSFKEVSESNLKEIDDLVVKIRKLENELKEARQQLDQKLETMMEDCETCDFPQQGSLDRCINIANCQKAKVYKKYAGYTIPEKI